MIYETKQVEISAPNADEKQHFDLKNVFGRDAIADQILKDIDEYCVKAYDDGPRSHLGASQLGHPCARYLWFVFRWMGRENFDGRMLRLFNRGHHEEDRVIEWLRGIGFEVKQVDVDGKQIRIASCEGHFGGSCDGNGMFPARYGIKYDKPILLEFKTANADKFKYIKSMGVIKAKPQHWVQSCVYGYKLGLEYLLYICVGKNDDELDIEVLQLDWELAREQEQKALYVIQSQAPPPRLSDNPSHWECKFCAMHKLCFFQAVPLKNCRSCYYATPGPDATWFCHRWNATIPKEHIATGCDGWTPLLH